MAARPKTILRETDVLGRLAVGGRVEIIRASSPNDPAQ
jgi:hypothetical protein